MSCGMEQSSPSRDMEMSNIREQY